MGRTKLMIATDSVALLGELVKHDDVSLFAFAGTQVTNIGGSTNQSITTGRATGFNVSALSLSCLGSHSQSTCGYSSFQEVCSIP